MAWETRKRGGKYYVRKHRTGTRVISEYIGRGEAAELIARLDDLERAAAHRDQADKRLQDKLRTKCFATTT